MQWKCDKNSSKIQRNEQEMFNLNQTENFQFRLPKTFLARLQKWIKNSKKKKFKVEIQSLHTWASKNRGLHLGEREEASWTPGTHWNLSASHRRDRFLDVSEHAERVRMLRQIMCRTNCVRTILVRTKFVWINFVSINSNRTQWHPPKAPRRAPHSLGGARSYRATLVLRNSRQVGSSFH